MSNIEKNKSFIYIQIYIYMYIYIYEYTHIWSVGCRQAPLPHTMVLVIPFPRCRQAPPPLPDRGPIPCYGPPVAPTNETTIPHHKGIVGRYACSTVFLKNNKTDSKSDLGWNWQSGSTFFESALPPDFPVFLLVWCVWHVGGPDEIFKRTNAFQK